MSPGGTSFCFGDLDGLEWSKHREEASVARQKRSGGSFKIREVARCQVPNHMGLQLHRDFGFYPEMQDLEQMNVM